MSRSRPVKILATLFASQAFAMASYASDCTEWTKADFWKATINERLFAPMGSSIFWESATGMRIEECISTVETNIISSDGFSLLEYASGNSENPEVLKQLVEDGADVNFKDKHGLTPALNAAGFNPSADILDYLLKAGASLDTVSSNGDTLLHIAAQNNNSLSVISLLLSRGLSVDATNADGLTPLHFAAANSTSDEVIKALLDAGADISAQSDLGWTPLHFAASSNSPRIVELLLASGADANKENFDGLTPLHTAAVMSKYPGVIISLVAGGGDINHGKDFSDSTIKYHGTPLHLAALSPTSASLDVIRALINANASLNARDTDGFTPIEAAQAAGAPTDMIAVLKEAENDRAAALDATGRDCKSIEGAAERLACFDSAKAPNLNETNGSVGLSNWRSTIEKSELTDSLNVILSVTSEDVVSCGRVTEQSAILVVRCTEDTTAIFVSTDCQLASGFQGYGNVEYRVDDNSMGKAAMDVDTSSTSLGLWSGASAIPLIKKILGGKDLILRFTPYNSIPVTVKFSIEGFNEAIVPLRRQCGW